VYTRVESQTGRAPRIIKAGMCLRGAQVGEEHPHLDSLLI